MSIAHGIVVGGIVIPGTDRVIRDSCAWWTEGRETRPRDGRPVDMLIGHWTAGPARVGPAAGKRLFDAMEARENKDGEDLSVSVQLSISWDGLIWQHADLETGCVHVGARPIIRRSVGVECMWPGTTAQAARLGVAGASVRRPIDGVTASCLAPSDALLESWRWLADTLTGPDAGALGLRIPRRTLGLRRTLGELTRSPGGVGEHATLPRGAPVKIDACGLLMDATGYPAG